MIVEPGTLFTVAVIVVVLLLSWVISDRNRRVYYLADGVVRTCQWKHMLRLTWSSSGIAFMLCLDETEQYKIESYRAGIIYGVGNGKKRIRWFGWRISGWAEKNQISIGNPADEKNEFRHRSPESILQLVQSSAKYLAPDSPRLMGG